MQEELLQSNKRTRQKIQATLNLPQNEENEEICNKDFKIIVKTS